MSETTAPQSPEVPPRQPPVVSILWLTFAGASSPFCFNFIGPVLPAIQDSFALPASQVQWLVSVYSLMLGLGQLLMGPISDAYGRRGVLLAGLVMMTFGSVGAMLARSFEQLLWCRFLQGFGACTSLVVPRAVVRDIYTRPDDVARAIAIITIALSVTPGIAPLIAGVLLSWFSWRSGFAACAMLGAVSLVLALRHHPETLAHEKRAPLQPLALLKAYIGIGSSLRFWSYTVTYTLLNTGVIGFLVLGPAALAKMYDYAAWGMAVTLLIVYAGFACGNLYAARHIRRTGVNRMLTRGIVIGVCGALGFLATAHFWAGSILAIMLPLFINSVGNGLAFPSGIAGAVGLNPARAGTAAALVGATQLSLCAVFAIICGAVADGSMRPLAWMVIGSVFLAVLTSLPVLAARKASAH
jgi:DHA1 family bicyclomycin/chloramphenicol resistance-like MFS transporter